MAVSVNSFAKINLGLCIGGLRADGFHELRTVYQTIALHDRLRVSVERGKGIEIHCSDPRIPLDESNTCYRVAERFLAAIRAKGKVVVEIEKRLPVQGGLGGASSNGVAVLLALERVLGKRLAGPERLRIAAEVGSDLPLFLLGGTVLGTGRGEEVYPLPDLAATPCVVAAPEIGVSTPQAFADWDETGRRPAGAKLTLAEASDRMNEFGRRVSSWLSGFSLKADRPASGVPARGRGRAEILLLDLVRTGIENDFEKVVFPKYPEVREVKRALLRAGVVYGSLSGSGSALYGLMRSRSEAQRAALQITNRGIAAQATTTLTRQQYWKKIFD
jgi:4-diphosphocytidyl-2-C-methyl-D-erythritol kinase